MIIFYDGYCPLCVTEMGQLRQLDTSNQLILEDIHQSDFAIRYPQIDANAANQVLHALDDNGNLLLGLDVTCAAWKTVGHHGWIQVLRWPVIRWFADKFYLLFAKHRYSISFLLTGKRRCEPCTSGTCATNDFLNKENSTYPLSNKEPKS